MFARNQNLQLLSACRSHHGSRSVLASSGKVKAELNVLVPQSCSLLSGVNRAERLAVFLGKGQLQSQGEARRRSARGGFPHSSALTCDTIIPQSRSEPERPRSRDRHRSDRNGRKLPSNLCSEQSETVFLWTESPAFPDPRVEIRLAGMCQVHEHTIAFTPGTSEHLVGNLESTFPHK